MEKRFVIGRKARKESYNEGWCDGFIQAWNTQAQMRKGAKPKKETVVTYSDKEVGE